jgi:hypothetical protein
MLFSTLKKIWRNLLNATLEYHLSPGSESDHVYSSDLSYFSLHCVDNEQKSCCSSAANHIEGIWELEPKKQMRMFNKRV